MVVYMTRLSQFEDKQFNKHSMIAITKKSTLTGIVRTKEFPITEDQYLAWQSGILIQEAMPNLSLEDREFIITGITKEEWDEHFPEEEE